MAAHVKTTLLIDADILAYATASSHQKVHDWGDGVTTVDVQPVEEAVAHMASALQRLTRDLEADGFVICLSDDNVNWRKSVLPTYKGHRSDSVRPELLYPLKDHLCSAYPSYRRPTLEADDVMGIIATTPAILPGHRKIICSIDKDLRQIPGELFDGKTICTIKKDEADWWHFMQMLTGDSVDGYKGCPGVGPVKAEVILLNADDNGTAPGGKWPGVVAAYEAKGLTEADALVQARVSRICRHEDYDFKKREVILWEPK